MKLLVCISKVPDTTSKINFVDNNTKFDENGVQYIVNPYDEWYALVRALELVEAQGGSVTTITVGTASDDPTIRKALAIGANDAVRIDADPSDPYFVAKQIAEYAKNENYDIILTGKNFDVPGVDPQATGGEVVVQPLTLTCEAEASGPVSYTVAIRDRYGDIVSPSFTGNTGLTTDECLIEIESIDPGTRYEIFVQSNTENEPLDQFTFTMEI